MSATSHRNLLTFAELTGPKSAKNVVLATTMWDKPHLMYNDGDKRETVLKEMYWNDMIDHGATAGRFLNSPDSAWSIIDNIIKNDHKAALLFQEEKVDQKQPFLATTAGRALSMDLDMLIQRQKHTMQGPVGRSDSNGNGSHSPIESRQVNRP